MEIGKTILNQIKSVDRMALMAWGSKNYLGGKVWNGKEGVQFSVSGPNAKRGSKISVVYDEVNDLYDVYIWRSYRGELKIDNNAKGVYCDMLVEIIDEFVG